MEEGAALFGSLVGYLKQSAQIDGAMDGRILYIPLISGVPWVQVDAVSSGGNSTSVLIKAIICCCACGASLSEACLLCLA